MEEKWEEFEEKLQEEVVRVDSEGGVDQWNGSLCNVISTAMSEFVPIKKAPKDSPVVPWWNEVCNSAVRARNKANRRLRRFPMKAMLRSTGG